MLGAGSVQEWEEWRGSVRMHMRKPLGVDFRRRRYWVIGGQAAAWRVYVEDDEGVSWGFYEGVSLSSSLCLLPADFPLRTA